MKKLTESIMTSLKESEASDMTIEQYAKNLHDGYIDIDVTDTEIDMSVALVYDVSNQGNDSYDEFLKILCQRTRVIEQVGDVLVCDFSSLFKPYNEQFKEFFDMNNSEFGEDEAYHEAVTNLEALISGNAGDKTYDKMVEILSSSSMNESIEDTKEYSPDYGLLEWMLQCIDYRGDIPTLEEVIDEYDGSLTQEEYNKCVEVVNSIKDIKTYEGYLELSDNHTLNQVDSLENEEYAADAEQTYYQFVEDFFNQFKEDTGVELYGLGRSGRHICVEDTIENRVNYEELKSKQEAYEQQVIENTNRYIQALNQGKEPLEAYDFAISGEMNESYDIDGTPAEIVADNIMHADSDPRFQSAERVNDEYLASELAMFALETTDEDYYDEYTDDEYYEKNKKDYLRQINDIKFIEGVLDLLKTRQNNLGDREDEEYGSENLSNIISKFETKLKELTNETNK